MHDTHHASEVHVDHVVEVLDRHLVEGPVACRRLADRQDDIVRRDDVDLLVEDLVLAAPADRDDEDRVDVVRVRLDRRARLVVVPDRLEQPFHRPVMQLPRQARPQALLARVEQVDPPGHAAGVRRRFG